MTTRRGACEQGVEVLGQGEFGMVVMANFRGTTVVVKKALPSRDTAGGTLTSSLKDTPMASNGSESSKESLDCDAKPQKKRSRNELRRNLTFVNNGLPGPSTNGLPRSVSATNPTDECSDEKNPPSKVTRPVQCSDCLAAGSARNGNVEFESSSAPMLKSFDAFSGDAAGLIYACERNGRHRRRTRWRFGSRPFQCFHGFALAQQKGMFAPRIRKPD